MPSRSRVLVRAPAILLATVFLAALYWTIRAGRADFLSRQGTAESAGQASALMPGNAVYHARLADLDNQRRRAELEKAVALNPYFAAAWIELGLLDEAAGDAEAAESHLLEAARVDRTFTPRWSLASFYFRRQNEPAFWEWARKTEEMSFENNTALYRLCWRMTQDAGRILERVIPNEPDHLARYLLYLLEDGHLEAGAEPARRLMAGGSLDYRGIVIGLAEQLLIARDARRSLELWNEMARRKWIPYAPLDPARGESLTNGEFGHAPLGRGFDWRPLGCDGMEVSAGPGSVRVAASGNQEDHCELLLQYLPLAPSTGYRLQVEWDGNAPGFGSGLAWQAADSGSGERWPLAAAIFKTGPETDLGRLTLRYDRPAGAGKLRGRFRIKRVALRPAR